MSAATEMNDASSNNGPLNLRDHRAAGRVVLALKVSEGTRYAWGDGLTYGARWHELGGVVWWYHFLAPGSAASGAAQADYFWNHVKGHVGPGDRFVLDCETSGENGAEAHAYINRLHDHAPNVTGLIYGGPYFLRDHGITPVHGWGLWLAEYNTHVDFVPPGWAHWDAWQYTRTAVNVPGFNGQVDQSHLSEGIMPLTDADVAKIWAYPLENPADNTKEPAGRFLRFLPSHVDALKAGIDAIRAKLGA